MSAIMEVTTFILAGGGGYSRDSFFITTAL